MLTEEQFKTLAMLTEGKEPLSMMFVELVLENGDVRNKAELASCVEALFRQGYCACTFCDGSDMKPVGCVDQAVLVSHYDCLEGEMERCDGKDPYSKGEYILEITDKGRTEYDSDAYTAYW